MVLSPPILVLLAASALPALAVAVAAVMAGDLVLRWDETDWSEAQLGRERRGYLIELLLSLLLPVYVLTLFFFVATVERIHPLFTGAMCGFGVLNASRFGMAALALKVAAVSLCATWLLIHHATNRGDAGKRVVSIKLLVVIPLAIVLLGDAVVQARFFHDLRPDIITSCCAIAFEESGDGAGSRLAALPVQGSQVLYFVVFGATAMAAWKQIRARWSPCWFAALSVLLSASALVSVVVWIAPSLYELPSHHCPLCLLAPPLTWTGYLLYASLAVGAVAGVGSGLIRLLRRFGRSAVRDGIESRLSVYSLFGFAGFTGIAVVPMLKSAFRAI